MTARDTRRRHSMRSGAFRWRSMPAIFCSARAIVCWPNRARRLSLPLAVAFERAAAKPEWRPVFTAAWSRSLSPDAIAQLREGLDALQAEDRCRVLLEGYKEQAIRALADVESPTLKGLLRR